MGARHRAMVNAPRQFRMGGQRLSLGHDLPLCADTSRKPPPRAAQTIRKTAPFDRKPLCQQRAKLLGSG
jgi:hypothetical protein